MSALKKLWQKIARKDLRNKKAEEMDMSTLRQQKFSELRKTAGRSRRDISGDRG